MGTVRPWKPCLSIGGGATGFVDDGVRVLALPAPSGSDPVAGKRVLGGYLDLLHWMLSEPDAARGRLVLPSATEAALDAVATLERARKNTFKIEVHVANEHRERQPPDFSNSAKNRAKQLEQREAAEKPELVERFERAVGDPRFFVYRNLGGRRWFGKIEGLRLCEFALDGSSGALKIGTGSGSLGRLRKSVYVGFYEAVDEYELPFAIEPSGRQVDIADAAEKARRLIESRVSGRLATTYREGRLEARVLSDEVRVTIRDVGTLEVASRLGQFPTLWSPKAPGKELDVLMRHSDQPWAVELKHHDPAGIVTYYRHAVGQAVLYREFIRAAKPLYGWFEQRGLKAQRCEAAVAVTKSEHPKSEWTKRLEHVQRLAALFGIEVVVLGDPPT